MQDYHTNTFKIPSVNDQSAIWWKPMLDSFDFQGGGEQIIVDMTLDFYNYNKSCRVWFLKLFQ